jgi:hypothetical protein
MATRNKDFVIIRDQRGRKKDSSFLNCRFSVGVFYTDVNKFSRSCNVTFGKYI